MLLMDIFEARDPKKSYHISEVKGKLDKITVKLEGSESASWTKLGKRYKEINDALKKLQDERDEMNEKVKKDMLDNYFDAEDAVMTRIVETVSLTAQIGKTPTPSPKVDNDKVVLELLKLMPELKEKIESLQKECSSTPTAKSPSLTIKTESVGDVWDKFKAKLGKFLAGIMSWGTKYDAKLANIKQMLKPQRQVAESGRTIAYYDAKHQEHQDRMDSGKAMKAKTLVKNLKDSSLPQADLDALIKAMTQSGIDGDMIVDAKQMKKLAAFAKVDYDDALASAGLLEAIALPAPAGSAPAKFERLPPLERDAAYFKKVSGFKAGTVALKSPLVNGSYYIGDWVRITEPGKNENKYGYIVSKSQETDEPYTGPAGGGNIWKFKIDISTTDTPNLVEVDTSKVARNKKWSAIDSITTTLGGKAGEKAVASKEKADTKATATKNSTEMPTSIPSHVYGKVASQPNMNFRTAGQALHVDETKARTAEEKKVAKDTIKVLEADYKIHKEFVAANPSPRDKERAQVLKNAERAIGAFTRANSVLDDYIGIIKMLNTTANNGDRELFDEARKELSKTLYPLYEDLKVIKLRMSVPEYVSRARVLAAVAIDTMFAEAKKVEQWAKRRDWSKEKIAAAKKTSDRMKLAWLE